MVVKSWPEVRVPSRARGAVVDRRARNVHQRHGCSRCARARRQRLDGGLGGGVVVTRGVRLQHADVEVVREHEHGRRDLRTAVLETFESGQRTGPSTRAGTVL